MLLIRIIDDRKKFITREDNFIVGAAGERPATWGPWKAVLSEINEPAYSMLLGLLSLQFFHESLDAAV